MSKETALVPQYGPTVNDAELVYWNGLTGGAHKNVKEAKHAFFDSQGIPWSVLNDREYRYLSTQFGAGTYNDLEEKYWQSGGSPIAAAVGTLSSAGRKGVLPGSAANRFWWTDRARTRPWDPATDLEKTVEFVDDLTGNPVGWQLGANVLPAGAWTQEAGTVSESLGRVTVAASGTTNARGYKSFPTVIGKTYRLVAKIVSRTATSGQLMIREGSGFGTVFATSGGITATTWATISFVATATNHSLSLWAITPTAGQDVVYESVAVQEVIRDESWLGANLVTNGTFAAGLASWTVAGNWTIGSGVATHTPSAGTENLDQAIALTAGRAYQIKFSLTRTAGTLIPMFVGGTAVIGPSYTASGEYELVLAATAGNNVIRMQASAAFDGSVDNITVREIPGHPIVSAVSGSGLVGSKRVNLASQTEFRNGLTDAPTRAGLITASAISGYAGAVAFGHDGTTSSWAYKTNYTAPASTPHRFSVVVQMDDGLPPNIGAVPGSSAANDFAFAVANAIFTGTPTIVNLGGGAYRVSGLVTTPASPIANIGVVKYNTNSNRTFKVTGWDVRLAIWDSFNLPAYQRVNDGTAGVFDYDDAGFPLHLKNVTGTQAMMTLGTVDMSAGDAGVLLANVVKLSDAAAQMIAETSANIGVSTGGAYLIAPSSAAAGNYSFAARGTSSASAVASAAAPAILALYGEMDVSGDICRLYNLGALAAQAGNDQGTGNLGNHRLNIAARDAGGTASLRFTGYYIGNFPALVAGDAGLNLLSLSREYAAQGGFVY